MVTWKGKGYEPPARRIRRVLFVTMGLVSAAIIAMATVDPIVGTDLLGSASFAGLPAAMVLTGSVLGAPAWGYVSDRIGRRGVLTLGLALGSAGAALAGWGVAGRIPVAYFAALVPVGAASAAVQLSRFAAGEVHPTGLRGRAISTVLLGGAVGSIAGPLLVAPTGVLALRAGRAELAGPYGVAMLLFLVAMSGVVLLLRPEPRDLGRQVAALEPDPDQGHTPVRAVSAILRSPLGFLALASMGFGQLVMIMVMIITSLHMRSHGHALGSISVVIASHTFGMFAFSIFSGRLADRYGRIPVIAGGGAILFLACLAARMSPDVVPLALSLFLLGLGWNFCYVGGSALLSDQLRPAERARTQGVNDMLVGASSAVGSLTSGVVFAAVGYSAMALVGAGMALIPLGLALAARRRLAPAAGTGL